MNTRISAIRNGIQDRDSDAWKKLCEYIDYLAHSGGDEFSPKEALGAELFSEIRELPESIGNLKKVKKIWLYGSKIERIPPEIGEMESLEYFDPYTSYELHWFPYEITRCKRLKDSRISTRVLYGNYKNRMGFPNLDNNPVRYAQETVKCSICGNEMNYNETNQLWISLRVGTDVVPLLINSCSEECEKIIPAPPDDYVPYPHKGGSGLKQPLTEDEKWELEMEKRESIECVALNPQVSKKKEVKLLSVIRKIWEKR